ncbi:MAG TPA: hypothetical protein PLG90_11030 [Ignavibacteria bacterium]|nr:hypothetical protein [Ignavibacteria bacterium]
MNSKFLYNILKTFSELEFREFGKFLNSPYHNNRSEVCRFYDAIKNYYPEFNSSQIQSEILFKKVYPQKKYSEVLLRKIFSLTSNLALEYLNISNFKSNKLEFSVKLLYELYERNLTEPFKRKSKQTEKLLEESLHDAQYYEEKFKYTSKLIGFLSDNVNIPDYQKELDEFIDEFIVVVFHIYHRLLVTQNIYNVKYDFRLYKEVFELLESYDYSSNTLISIYYNLIKLFETQDEKYFYELIRVSDKFKKKLSPLYLYNIFVTVADFSMNKIARGEFKYRKIYFDFAKNYFADFKTKIVTGYLNPVLFSSLVRNASNLNEFEWTEKFIKNYIKTIEPDKYNESLNYAYAELEFHKGNYAKSLEYVYEVNPLKVVMKTNSKKLQLLNFFELGYHNELISLIDSFKHFIQREKLIGETIKKRNLPFIKYLSELNLLIIKNKPDDIQMMKKKLENSEYFVLKEWLISKIDIYLSKQKVKVLK